MIVSLLLFAGILWLFVLGMEKGTHSPGAAGFCGLFISLFMSVVSGSLALLLTGFLMMLVGFVCHWRGMHGARFAKVTLAMVPLALVITAVASHDRIEKFRQWQEKYKFESLAERLAYEEGAQKTLASAAATSDVPAVNLSTESRDLLEEVDQRAEQENFIRPWLLQQLHATQLDAFANSPGFGVGRGIRFYDEQQIRNAPRPAIVPPAAPEVPYQPEGTKPAAGDIVQAGFGETEQAKPLTAAEPLNLNATMADLPSSSTLKKLHRDSAIDFVNPQGFGLVESPRRVSGFDAHAFSKLPVLEPPPGSGMFAVRKEVVANRDWMLVSLQLVSMLKHETPVIYATNELPRMDRLRSEDIPTRPLDPFEASALLKIKEGELVVVEESTNRIRMLGAVRAGKTCMECHEVPPNTLLGAFSYELARTQPVPEKKPDVEKPEL